MYMNLHSHTPRCGHAVGEGREYVENAIKAGIKVFGFSDHVPMPFDNDHYSNFRMALDETEGYVKEITSLREEYKDDIQILVGYEAEYYPKHFKAMMNHLKQYELDYLIMGQHCLNNEYDGVSSGWSEISAPHLTAYVDQVLEGLSTGVFTYLCHPDLIHYEIDDDHFRKEMTRLCLGAKEMKIPLEFNLLGFRDAKHYPKARFFQIAAEVGNDVVLGIDAHDPEWILDLDAEQKAVEMLGKLGITPLKEITLVNPCK